MTKEECIGLLKRYAEYDGMGIPNLAGCKEAMRMAAELLERPSLPSNLDEAAAFRLAVSNYLNSLNEEDVYKNTQKVIIEAIRFGAEWMAEQGVSIDGKVIMDFSEPADIINRRLIAKLGDSLLKIEPGDVVVQIRKK